MGLANVLLSPLHLVQVATGAKSFEHPVLGSRRLNERGLHVARVRAAMRMADRRRRRLASRVDAEHREAYARDGYVMIEDFLPADTFAAVSRELEEPFERFDMLQGSTVTRRAMLDRRDVADRPGLRAARGDRRMADLVRYVASHGGQPLFTLQVVMALPSASADLADPQTMLHSDTFQPTAKSWLFLRDVGEADGPFAYVPGSHRMTPERYAWEDALARDPHAIENRYSARGSLRVPAAQLGDLGYGQPRPMVVRANTLVVADTHGFHARSPSPRRTTRVEIYGSLRRNPFLPWPGGHVASLPFVASRTNRLVTDGLATLQRMGVKNSPWTEAGVGRPDEWSARLPAG